jgi:hypothetical protein
MIGVMVDVAMLAVFLFGLVTLVRLTLLRVGLGPVRLVRRIAPQQEALSLVATDRFIRDQEHELEPDRTFKHVNCAVCGPGPLLRGTVPSSFEHPFFRMETQTHHDGYGGKWQTQHPKAALPEYAEMVSSKVIEEGKYTGMHTVMLDLDFPVTLMESSTPGHHHLYIDHLMNWREYRGLLRALDKVDLIEHGYYCAAVRQHATMLRPPWVKKQIGSPVPKKRRNLPKLRPESRKDYKHMQSLSAAWRQGAWSRWGK